MTPSRRGLVPPFIAMDVLREALAREAAGHSVIHLEVGQPGTPAWFELHARDHAGAVAFYQAALGWDPKVVSDTDTAQRLPLNLRVVP